MTNNVFYSYGGSDTVIYVNKKLYGEIQKLKFNNSTNELEITIVLFLSTEYQIEEPSKWYIEEDLTSLQDSTVEQVSAAINEDLDIINYMYRRFTGVTFKYKKGGIAVDDISEQVVFVFDYKEESGLYNLPAIPVDTISEYMDKIL